MIRNFFISRIYRELKKLSPQRINTPMKKWAHELNRDSQKKMTLRFHLTPVRMAIINSNNNNKC
jgi:hypothetical protein